MAGALCGLVLAVVVVVVPRIAQEHPIDQLLSLQRRLETTTDIQIANVSLGKSWGNGRTTTYVAVSAVVFPRPSDLKAMASRIARDVLSNFPPAAERDLLVVQLTYGYDIGIARSSESARYQWSPKALADSQGSPP